MTPGKWKPRSWVTPKTRHTRERPPSTLEASQEVLRELYPLPGSTYYVRPQWAKLALGRHWISYRKYWSIDKTEKKEAPELYKSLYSMSPFLGMLRKETSFEKAISS